MTSVEMKPPGDVWAVIFSGVRRRLRALGSKPGEFPASKGHRHIQRLLPRANQNLPFDARIAALTNALNADRGMRTRAVHLVIVEQTLRQGVAGGLSAVPADVLELATVQLRKLSLFGTSLELQRLWQSMRSTLKAQASMAGAQQTTAGAVNRVLVEFPTVASTPREVGIGRSPSRSSEPPGQHASGRGGSVEDDFPDTQAFDDHDAGDHDEIVLPMPAAPPVDRGATMGTGGLWR